MAWGARWKIGLAILGVFWCALLLYLVSSLEWTTVRDDHGKEDSFPKTADITGLQIPVPVVQVIMAADKNGLGGLMTAVNSIVRNTRHPVMFHFITSPETVDYLRNWIQLSKLYHLKYEIQAYPEEYNPGLQFAKLYLSKLFPQLEGKVLYLDNDVIVKGDITELFNTTISAGHYGAFSEDCTSVSKRFSFVQANYASHVNFNNFEVRKLHLNPQKCSFNTGVFLTNLTRWRQEKIAEQLDTWITISKKEPIYVNEFSDDETQAAMLLVFYDKVSPINPMWHVRHLGITTGSRYSRSFLEKAKLLHWSGRFKPWGRNSAYSNQWDHYYVPDPSGQFHPVRKKKLKVT